MGLVRCGVLLAAAAGTAVSAGAGEDAAALLQVGAAVEVAPWRLRRLQKHGTALSASAGTFAPLLQEDACECLPWKDVYQKHGVECGKGRELTFAGGYAVKADYGPTFCTRFYEKLSDNFCVQLHYGQMRTDQWCYVSPACESLNGGEVVESVKWKRCEPGRDRMLSKMSPEKVYEVALATDTEAGVLLKMAYPVFKAHVTWSLAKLCVEYPNEPIEQCNLVKQVQASEEPMVFDTKTGKMPFGVIFGKKAYEVHFTRQFMSDAIWHPETIGAAIGNITEYACVVGCSSSPKP